MSGRADDRAKSGRDQLPRLDHVGVMVRDLDAAAHQWQSRFGVAVASMFEAPALHLRATFLDLATATIELFTIDEPAALNAALGQEAAKIDHIALRFDRSMSEMDLTDCAFRGPGRPHVIEKPFQIAGSDQVWTEPPGIDVLLQLITPASAQP